MTSRPVIRWPMLLICAAMLVPIVQLVVGIPMVGSHRAHDGRFAVATLEQFEAELAAGNMVPRWAFTGHGGLGSPIFYFYPPGAYFVAALLGFSVPGLPTATIIGIAQVLLRAGAMLSCFAWLRRRTTTDAALTGSALYALMPYVAVLNPQVRLAFAECAAAAFVPLVFAAIDVARGRAIMSVALVAPAICALAAVHLPTTVLVGGLACVYSALAGNTWLDRGSRTVATAAAVALGLGMAGWFLVPALGLLGTISAAALSDAAHSPENHFLLWHNTFRDAHGPLQGLLLDFSLVVPVAMSLLFGHAALRNHRTSWSLLGTFLVAVLLTLPLSEPLWTLRSPMREVQFSWRLLLPISLLASALVAIALPIAAQAGVVRRLLPASSQRWEASRSVYGSGTISARTIRAVDSRSQTRLRTPSSICLRWPRARVGSGSASRGGTIRSVPAASSPMPKTRVAVSIGLRE